MSNLSKFDQLTPDAIKLIQQVCCFRRNYGLQIKFELIGLLKSWNASEDTIWTGVGLFEDCQLNSSTSNKNIKCLNNFEQQISCARRLLIHRHGNPENALPEIVDAAIAYVIVQMKESIKRRPIENGLILPFHTSQTGIICELFHDLESAFSKSNHWSHLKACFDQLLPNGVPETYLSDNDRMIFEIQVLKNHEMTDRDVSWIKEDIIRGAHSRGFETAQKNSLIFIAPRYQDEKLLQLWLTREHNRLQVLRNQHLWNFSVSKTRYSSQNWERETLDLTRFDQLMIYLRQRENLIENELKSSPLT